MTTSTTCPTILTDKWYETCVVFATDTVTIPDSMDPSAIIRPTLQIRIDEFEHLIYANFGLNDESSDDPEDFLIMYEGDSFADIFKADLTSTDLELLRKWQSLNAERLLADDEHQVRADVMKALGAYVAEFYSVKSVVLTESDVGIYDYTVNAAVKLTHTGLGMDRIFNVSRVCNTDEEVDSFYFGYMPESENVD